MAMKLAKRTVLFKTQMKGDMVRFNPIIIRDYQQTKPILSDILLKLSNIRFLEVARDIHSVELLA
jgi:hypothetical protein